MSLASYNYFLESRKPNNKWAEKLRSQEQQLQVSLERMAEQQQTIEKLHGEIKKLQRSKQASTPKENDFSSQMNSFLEKPKVNVPANDAASRLKAAWSSSFSDSASTKKVRKICK